MSTVGERLKHERESRNTTIEQIAEATGIGLSYLEAMERNEFDTLPGRAFGKLYVRAYAAVLDFDPQPLIDAYDRAQRMEMNSGATAARPEAGAPRPVAAAIARWKEARQPESTPVELEPDPQPEPVMEQALEPEPEPEPDIAPAPIHEPEPEPEPEPVPDVAPAAIHKPEPVPDIAPAAILEPETEPVSVVAATPSRTRAIALIAIAVTSIAVFAFAISRRPAPVSPPRETTVLAEPPPAPATPPLESAPPAVAPEKPAAAAPARPQAKPPAQPGTLSVTESGVGRRVVSSQLQGEADRFDEGTVVYFQTRVQGGVRGQAFRHVWIYEGRAQQSIPLRLGGADWRTHSTKTLYKTGTWTVEARDGEGRVLAKATFACEARPH